MNSLMNPSGKCCRHSFPRLSTARAVVVERNVNSPETDWPECFIPTTQKLKKRTYGIARMDMAVYHADLAGEED